MGKGAHRSPKVVTKIGEHLRANSERLRRAYTDEAAARTKYQVTATNTIFPHHGVPQNAMSSANVNLTIALVIGNGCIINRQCRG